MIYLNECKVLGDFMKSVKIYTDGACSGNPGPGGWAAILEYQGKTKELSGGDKRTTNNRMELSAVISGLKALKEQCEVEVITDSKYVVDGITKGWARSWKKNNWVKSNKQPALNPELWDELLNLVDYHVVKFTWIKGHAGHKYNERCDRLAVEQSKKF